MLVRTLCVLLLLASGTAFADLSWEYVDQRTRQAKELLEQGPAIEAIVERERARHEQAKSPAARKAYENLGKALAEHPEMKEVNHLEAAATQAYQKAVASGLNVDISLAAQELAEAKVTRYRKAASIPELKAAIDAWQKAATGTEAATVPTKQEQSAIDEIHAKLNELGQSLGR